MISEALEYKLCFSVYHMQVSYLLSETSQTSGIVFADYHHGLLREHYLVHSCTDAQMLRVKKNCNFNSFV